MGWVNVPGNGLVSVKQSDIDTDHGDVDDVEPENEVGHGRNGFMENAEKIPKADYNQKQKAFPRIGASFVRFINVEGPSKAKANKHSHFREFQQ